MHFKAGSFRSVIQWDADFIAGARARQSRAVTVYRTEDILQLLGETRDRSGQSFLSHSECPVSDRRSAGRKPYLSGPDGQVFTANPPTALVAGRLEQPFFDDRVLFYWIARPQFFRRFASGSAGGRRAGGHLNRMGHVDGQRRDAGHGPQKRTSVGPRRVWPRVLSADAATDRGPRIHFRSRDSGRELDPSLRVPHLDHSGRNYCYGRNRGKHFPLLRLCRPLGSNSWQNRYDRDRAAFVVPAGLHWSANYVERTQRPAVVASISCILAGTHLLSVERRMQMPQSKSSTNEIEISRDRLAELLNEDLAREYQAIISYVVYSQVLSGAEYMDIADQLEIHAKQELDHALTISRQIDYLGKMPAVTPKPVRTSKNAKEMLRFDLENENETIRNYRDRIRQCEALGEYAMAEQIRQILVQEQDHQIDLATALGEDVPDVSGPQGRGLRKAS